MTTDTLPIAQYCDDCGAEPYEACRWYCLSHDDALADVEDWIAP